MKCLLLILALGAFEGAGAQKIMPVASANNYTLTAGSLVLTVGPGQAGRIRSLKYQGTELLYVTSGSLNWGSTFWPSPKAYWTTTCKNANPPQSTCFPPAANLDADNTTYSGGLVTTDTTVSYTGQTDANTAGTHLRFRKTYWANAKDSSFTMRYIMVNSLTSASSVVAFAPWEITRFVGGGLTFYPIGLDALKGTAALLTSSKDTLGTRWFKYDSTSIPTGSPAIYSDGSGGWLAHVDKNRVVHIKVFKDTPVAKQVPTNTSQGEINWYVDPAKAYQEVEPQGLFDTIPPNDSTTWDVKWIVRKLPDNVVIGRNSDLLNFVTQAVSGSVTALHADASRFAGFSERNGVVEMDLIKEAAVSVSVMDLRGRKTDEVYSGKLSAGHHSFFLKSSTGIRWLVARNLASGQILFQRMLAPVPN